MDAFKDILDSLKTFGYEFIAIFLPGACLLLAVSLLFWPSLLAPRVPAPGGAQAGQRVLDAGPAQDRGAPSAGDAAASPDGGKGAAWLLGINPFWLFFLGAYIVGRAIQGISFFDWVNRIFNGRPPTGTSSKHTNEELLEIVKDVLSSNTTASKRKAIQSLQDAHFLRDICLSGVGKRRNIYDQFTWIRDFSKYMAIVSFLVTALWAAHSAGYLACNPVHGLGYGAAGAVLTLAFYKSYRFFLPIPDRALYSQFISDRLAIKDQP